MLKLIKCECYKLRRKPLVFASVVLSVLIPLAFQLLPSNEETSIDAVDGIMSVLLQLSGYFLLIPVIVVLAAHLLFEEQNYNTLKNLLTVPVSRTGLVMVKMLLLLVFSIGFMAAGGLLCMVILLLQGWEMVGFWRLFCVGLGEGVLMWVGALPCVFLVIILNKSYIISVIITFFYTAVNYIFSTSDYFIMQPFGCNPGTLLPGPLVFKWIFQFFDHRDPGVELAALLERISPYFLNSVQVFGVAAAEAVLFLTLIALVYRRQEV